MGKSDRKIKSDRVNALRKQYDAFLEEDKRRKERNEYILGRLDKMRYATSVVPLRHKQNLFTIDSQKPVVYSRSGYMPDNLQRNAIPLTQPSQNNLQLGVPKKYLDDKPLIQEISKRYILIPRTRPTFKNDYVEDIKNKVEDNLDWRSKYDILEQLKKKEKEEATEEYDLTSTGEKFTMLNLNGESLKYHDNLRHNNEFEIPTTCDNEELPHKSELEFPERDIVKNEICQVKNQEALNITESFGVNSIEAPNAFEGNNTDEMYVKYPEQSITGNNTTQVAPVEHLVTPNIIEETFVMDTILNSNIEKLPQDDAVLNATVEFNILEENSTINNEQTDMQDQYQQPFELTEYEESPTEEDHHIQDETDKVVYLHQDDTNQIEIMNPTDLVKEIDNEAPVELIQKPRNIGAINIQENIPGENVELQEGVNILNPEHTLNQNNTDVTYQHDIQNAVVAENTENPPVVTDPNESEIEAFDAEQREMFYSENTDENYAYSQEGGTLTHNYEYSIQDPNYQQNEEYAYYEGGPTDQTYHSEINEHEETNQPYDQTYEEQYGKYEEQQHYDQQQVQDQSPQEYDNVVQQPDAYDQTQQQQELDQLQYRQENYDTRPEVEAQLDKEEGFDERDENKSEKTDVKGKQSVQKAATEKVT